MLPDDFDDTLRDIVGTALERMAFMVGEPLASPLTDASFASCISIDVDGEPFRVCVRATEGAIQEVLSSLVDPEGATDEDAQLAVNELANVLGGEVLRVLGGDVRPSTLGLPYDGETSDEDERTRRCVMDFLGEIIEVAVTPGVGQ